MGRGFLEQLRATRDTLAADEYTAAPGHVVSIVDMCPADHPGRRPAA